MDRENLTSYSMDKAAFFFRSIKPQRHKADRSQFSAQIKNGWRYTFISPYAFEVYVGTELHQYVQRDVRLFKH